MDWGNRLCTCERAWEDKAVILHMRSGQTILEDFRFLEQNVSMADIFQEYLVGMHSSEVQLGCPTQKKLPQSRRGWRDINSGENSKGKNRSQNRKSRSSNFWEKIIDMYKEVFGALRCYVLIKFKVIQHLFHSLYCKLIFWIGRKNNS